MNADTGQVFQIGEDVAAQFFSPGEASFGGPGLTFEEAERSAGRELTEDESEALRQIVAGQRIVEVSPHVAQAVALGKRELDRRARRRKAAKQARKRNRYA